MSEVTVSASTQPIRAGQTRAASVPSTSARGDVDPADRSARRARPRGGAGAASTAGEPARARGDAPSGSSETTTIGSAPPAHAVSTRRRTFGTPSTSRRAESGAGGEDDGGDGHARGLPAIGHEERPDAVGLLEVADEQRRAGTWPLFAPARCDRRVAGGGEELGVSPVAVGPSTWVSAG